MKSFISFLFVENTTTKSPSLTYLENAITFRPKKKKIFSNDLNFFHKFNIIYRYAIVNR